ncbi:hypothetical protein I4U23_029690 [Adineta vaga]|nr:hypothetical protein I4U23_029690 [Adineta vaga]
MSTMPSETIWSSMISARQLSATFYTLSTCLTDLLHRYNEISSSQSNKILSSTLFHNLDQTLFSTVPSTNSSKLFDEYSNILQNILKQNSLHTNIIQNVRRLFRFDPCLKELFSTELNEHCQCQECDCTISNSITDVIHDVGEIRPTLLVGSSQTSCVCFRCGDQNQLKTITFKRSSPCLALIVNRLNITSDDHLINAQGVTYELVYIIELDSTSRSIINVYLRESTEFVKVDGIDVSSRSSTLNSQGKFLTLWLTSRSTSLLESTQPNTTTQTSTLLSPPQSASSSSQLISNSQTTTETSLPDQSTSAINFDDMLMPSNSTIDTAVYEDDDQFWNSLTEQSIATNSENPVSTISENLSSTNDSVSDVLLTLLHSTNKDSTPIKSRADHDRTVNTIASNVLWPLIVNQNKRRSEKKTSSSSTTTTIQSLSSHSSTTSSTYQRNRLYKQLPSTTRSRRPHPYTTA